MIRSRGLRIALAASLAATAWAALQPDDEPLEPLARPARGSPSPGAAGPRTASAAPMQADAIAAWPASPLRPTVSPWPRPEPHAVAAWGPIAPPAAPRPPSPAPAVAAAPAPPASTAPQAPPFPYALIGRVLDGSEVHALMTSTQRTLGARQGDVIDGQWRVDEIRPDGVTLTWLPGRLTQQLTYRPA